MKEWLDQELLAILPGSTNKIMIPHLALFLAKQKSKAEKVVSEEYRLNIPVEQVNEMENKIMEAMSNAVDKQTLGL